MKNKKLGKILLCTTLALATPFALAACGKKADDNTPDTPQEQQQEVRANYVKEVTWPTTASSVTKTTYQDDDAVRADLVAFIDNPFANAPEVTDPQAEGFMNYMCKLYYPEAMANLVQQYIKDGDGKSVNSELSAKYVYKVTEDMIPNRDNNKTLVQYYEEYFDAYAEKYTNDNTWHEIEGAEGAFYKTTATEDVFIGFEYNTDKNEFVIYEFSFSKNTVESAWNTIGEAIPAEIQRLAETANN